MIPFDFEYHCPDTIAEAVQIFLTLEAAGKNPKYYGGGTEIISMARMNNISTGAVIDIKRIPDCNALEVQDDHIVIGAGITLTQIHEANYFPLLSQAAARVADHTIQNKITLGGNLCGTIIYKEALLPLLLSDSEVILAGSNGSRSAAINDFWQEKPGLNQEEMIVQVNVPKKFSKLPYVHVKRTKQDKINYPLVTICALKADGEIRAAFSGLCRFPFRSALIEAELNNHSLPLEKRMDQVMSHIPGEILSDIEGSAAFRKFVLKNLLSSIVGSLEEEKA